MKKLVVLLNQFHFPVAMRLFITDAFRKLFDRDRISSYSQTGEDRIIDFYLGEIEPDSVYYVDIGCNHPFRMSNTMRLYQRGAKGLAVDANPSVIKKYKRARPRDIVVCACVSDRKGEGTLTLAKRDAMSTVSEVFAQNFLSSSDIERHITVSFVSASELFRQNDVPKNFELLSVDVEGHDLEVLRSLDLGVYRPKLIVVEMHVTHFSLEILTKDKVYSYLTKQGYILVAFATMNGYFLRNDQA